MNNNIFQSSGDSYNCLVRNKKIKNNKNLLLIFNITSNGIIPTLVFSIKEIKNKKKLIFLR